MKNVISASRRTDIPAFYTDWLLRRLEAGEVYVKSPYTGRVSRVSLQAADIHSIVFWSKNFSPLLGRITDVERTSANLFFHFTITGAPGSIERQTPEAADAAKDLVWIAKRYSPNHVIWRYDPILLTDELDSDYHCQTFERLASMLSGHARACYLSFAHPYAKFLRNFRYGTGRPYTDPEPRDKAALAALLSKLAEKYGIPLYSCCNDFLKTDKVVKGSCIDGRLLAGLYRDTCLSLAKRPTRKGCGCTASTDIGAYGSCAHGCVYCYANTDFRKAGKFLEDHNPEWNGLGFNVENFCSPDKDDGTAEPSLFRPLR